MTTDTIDLEEELPRRERRRLVTPVGIAAAAVVIAALGFLGGVQVQKSRGGPHADRPLRRRGGFPGAGAAPALRARRRRGRRRRAAQQTDATVGEVSSVDGKTIYVDDATGNTVKVKLAKGGKVTRTAVTARERDPPGRHGDRPGRDRLQRHGRGELDPRDREQRGRGLRGGFGGAAPGATGAPGGGG